MITFKQFIQDPALTEAVVKKWTVSSVEVDKAIKFLNANCKDGLRAITNGGLIYRGFSGAGPDRADGFAIVDSTKALRTSRDTDNTYQVLMDNSPAMKEFPKRGNSFICSSSSETAESYGRAYVMVPLDGAKIAVAPDKDIFYLKIKSPLYNGNPEGMSADVGYFLDNIGAPKTNHDYLDHKGINAAMRAFSPNELAILAYIQIVGPHGIKFNKKDDKLQNAYDDILSLERDPFRVPAAMRKSLKLLADALNIGQVSKNIKLEAYRNMFAENLSTPFYALANAIMSPGTTGIKLSQYGEALPDNREVWFSGKAMVIPYKVFARILLRLQEQKYPISKKVLKDMVYEISRAKKLEKENK